MKIKCKHWSSCSGGACCAIEKYTHPTESVCLTFCDSNTHPITDKQKEAFFNRSKGLGDTIKKVIDKVTFKKVKPCGGCKKRQEALNKLMTYKDKDTVN